MILLPVDLVDVGILVILSAGAFALVCVGIAVLMGAIA